MLALMQRFRVAFHLRRDRALRLTWRASWRIAGEMQ
ncbi:Uncharacterised protein [Bordetella hinzii]|nr:Uncharacterised protein [Bordetella hinzii]VEH33542.1 Uncharacterised protein [Bordetella hinzii]